jgi:hypothetical protein
MTHAFFFSRTLSGSLLLAGLLALGLLCWPATLAAQTLNLGPSGPGVKDYGRPGVPRINVYLWGSADTGAWTIEENTDLVEFLSVASQADFNNRPDSRTIRILKIYRDGYSDDDPFFERRLEELFARRTSYPALQEGDIVVLESRQRSRFTWRDIASVTGTVIGVLNTYLLLDRLNE